MDRVRFGRALGAGARETAKALLKAADAAAAPNPNPTRPAAQPLPRPVERAKTVSAGVARGGKRFGEAVWKPFARASNVLWLEVTGVLFGMFAAVAGLWAWNSRADLAFAGNPAHKEWLRIGMFLLFGYLTLSSYVQAARRSRR